MIHELSTLLLRQFGTLINLVTGRKKNEEFTLAIVDKKKSCEGLKAKLYEC